MNEKEIFISGGITKPSYRRASNTYILNVNSNTRTRKQNLNYARSGHISQLYNNEVYIFWGTDKYVVEKFLIEDNHSIDIGEFPEVFLGGMSIVHKKGIYIKGYEDIYRFDLITYEYSLIKFRPKIIKSNLFI